MPLSQKDLAERGALNMTKIKLSFLISLLLFSCSKERQYRVELTSITNDFIRILENCNNRTEFTPRLSMDESFVEIFISKNKEVYDVRVSFIEKELVFGESIPHFVANYKGYDVYIYGDDVDFLFKKIEPVNLKLELKKTKKNNSLIYDPMYLKVEFGENGTQLNDPEINGCIKSD